MFGQTMKQFASFLFPSRFRTNFTSDSTGAVVTKEEQTDDVVAPSNKALTMEEYLGVTAAAFNWADSYDAKDWERLRGIVAPELLIDYTHVSGKKWESMAPDEFIKMVSDSGFLGDPLLKTQHLLGMSEWIKVNDNYIIGLHQLRAAHLRYTDDSRAVEEMRGHSHATNEHYYRKINGEWKFAGLKPTIRWNEYEFEHVFKGFKAPRI